MDLWLLFPLGAGVMRLLIKSAPPPKAWQETITRMLGTTDWESEVYRTSAQTELGLGFDEIKSRDVDYLGVSEYLLRRLGEVFLKVHPKPFLLENSKNNTLYLFCFACGNEMGATPAMKIVEHLMKIQDAGKSSIEWTEATWNPVTGCSKISPDCKRCYANRLALRLQAIGLTNYRNGFEFTRIRWRSRWDGRRASETF